jgi:hypothetical protein
MPGFILRVLPTGKKVFFARYRGPDGKDRRQRLGLLGPAFGVEEARRAAMAILARREVADERRRAGAGREDGQCRAPARPKTPTIREFACRFEQEHIDMHLKPETASHFRSSLRRYIVPGAR